MHKFVRNLITEWRKLRLPFADETIVVAVSGGADSLALLLAIDDLRTRKKIDLRIIAAHFNHKLRGRESDADEDFVKQMLVEKGIELAVGRAAIQQEGNIEQNARNARYEFLHSTANNLKAGWVLTAHTMNDQAETFLLNLIRGSGIDGLSGMRTVRELGSRGVEEQRSEGDKRKTLPLCFSPAPLLVRPLLRWAQRTDTENFCRESGVEFRYDTMNEDMSFKRVRVRKMLLPMLKEFNPKIVETLAYTAELLSEPGAAAAGLVNVDPDTGCSKTSQTVPATLSISELKTLSQADLYETLRFWLKNRRGTLRSISHKHIEAIESLLKSTKSGRAVELPGYGLVRKHRGLLSFENIKVDK